MVLCIIKVLPFSIFWHNNPKNTPKIPQKYLRNTSNIQSIVMGFSFSAALFFIYLFIYYKCTSEAHDGSEIMKEFSRPNIWRAFWPHCVRKKPGKNLAQTGYSLCQNIENGNKATKISNTKTVAFFYLHPHKEQGGNIHIQLWNDLTKHNLRLEWTLPWFKLARFWTTLAIRNIPPMYPTNMRINIFWHNLWPTIRFPLCWRCSNN